MIDPHPDKKNDPRVQITARGVGLLVAVLIGATVFAAASIYARRTRLEKTTEFWGPETISAIQLGDHVLLRKLSSSGTEMETESPVDLTATPGLGHLRKALLDERHYDWTTRGSSGVAREEHVAGETSELVALTFSDPTLKRFPDAKLMLDLTSGCVGPLDESRSVCFNDRVRPAMKHQLKLLMNFQQKNYDARAAERE